MFFVLLALATGILAGWAFPVPFWGWFSAACLVAFTSLFFLKPSFFLVFVCLTAFLWTEIRMADICTPDTSPNNISQYTDGKKYKISGIIKSLPRADRYKTRYTMACSGLSLENCPLTSVQGRLTLSLYKNSGDKNNETLSYGEHIEIYSRIRPIRNFANPGGYDYEFMMHLEGISGTAYANMQTLKQTGRYSSDMISRLIRCLQYFRTRFSNQIAACVKESEPAHHNFIYSQASAVLQALITGQKEDIDEQTRSDFSQTGLAHLLAVSGFHLSMIGLGAYFIFIQILNQFSTLTITGWARKSACMLTLIPLAAYAVFTGFSPSTQRALIMAAVFITAVWLEKEKDPLNALFIAAVIILAIDPGALFSISFQLSFTCVFFIISGFMLLYKKGWMPANKWGRIIFSMIMTTVFAALGTAPLTAVYFNMISMVQVLTNLIIVPVIGFVCLPLGLAGLFLMEILPSLADVFISTDIHILSVVVKTVHYIAGFDWTWIRTVTPRPFEIIVYYLFILTCGAGVVIRRKQVVYLFVILMAAGTVSIGQGLLRRFHSGALFVHVLDVGQGNAAVIMTPEGRTVLIDGGGFGGRSTFNTGRFILGPFLWRNWVKTIDAVVLTHPESDHMGGLVFIFKNFKVRRWIRNHDTSPAQAFRDLVHLAREKNIPVHIQGSVPGRFSFGAVGFTVAGVADNIFGDNLNNNSLVSRIEYQNFSMLFPGDIEQEREKSLVLNRSVPLKSDILVAPHHGSKSSSSKIFLEKVTPRGVIISCGYMNRHGFPHKTVLARYLKNNIMTYRTDLVGAVTIQSDGSSFVIQTQRDF